MLQLLLISCAFRLCENYRHGGLKESSKSDKRAGEEGDIALDAELWGQLQEHIPLQIVYEKLSPDDLFRLRLVCKAWNHGALQRLLPKPSFVPVTPGYSEYDFNLRYLNGIVTYDVVSRRFGFKRHRFPLLDVRDCQRFREAGEEPHVQPFETEGLILCHNPDDCTQRGVFNVHTQTWHVIPPPPLPRGKSLSACGLMVDTSVKPYTFKLIEGNLDIDTQIYDSKTRSWSSTSSRLLQTAKTVDFGSLQYTCICNNGHVYISLGSLSGGRRSRRGRFMILKYSIEDDLWTTLNFPKVKWDDENNPEPDNSLGVWDGRIFTTRENCEKQRVTVWELVDSERQMWEEYAHTTKKQYDWLWNCDFGGNGPSIYEEMCLRSFFRDGYLLVAMWRWSSGRADALVMFNMATKKWQRVRLPMGTVAIEVQPVDNDTLSESDDDCGEDEVDNDDADDSEDSEG